MRKIVAAGLGLASLALASTAQAQLYMMQTNSAAKQTFSADQQSMTQKDIGTCLHQARLSLDGGRPLGPGFPAQSDQIDAYVAQGQIYFFNPFISQTPTFEFWKCLRLKGYHIP